MIGFWNHTRPAPPSTLSPEANYYSINLNLPFLGKIIRSSFPPTARFPQLFDSSSSGTPDVSGPVLCCPGRFYDLFGRSLELLWTCWELMVISEPILVVGDSPKACSEVVWSLVELVKPVGVGRSRHAFRDIPHANLAPTHRYRTAVTSDRILQFKILISRDWQIGPGWVV